MFAALLFCLQRFFFVCSVSFLFAAFLFCLQHVPCGSSYETPHPDREFKGLTKKQQRQSGYYNCNARDLPALSEGDIVRIKPFQLGDKVWKKGTVTSRLDERSYMVELPD